MKFSKIKSYVKNKKNRKTVILSSVLIGVLLLGFIFFMVAQQSSYEFPGRGDELILGNGDKAGITLFIYNNNGEPMYLEKIKFQFYQTADSTMAGPYTLDIAGVTYPLNVDCVAVQGVTGTCINMDDSTAYDVANRINKIYSNCAIGTGCTTTFEVSPHYTKLAGDTNVKIIISEFVEKQMPTNISNTSTPSCNNGVLDGGEKCIDCKEEGSMLGSCEVCVEGIDMIDGVCKVFVYDCVPDLECTWSGSCVNGKETGTCTDAAFCSTGTVTDERDCEIQDTNETDDTNQTVTCSLDSSCNIGYKCINGDCSKLYCTVDQTMSTDGHSCVDNPDETNYIYYIIAVMVIAILVVAALIIKKRRS